MFLKKALNKDKYESVVVVLNRRGYQTTKELSHFRDHCQGADICETNTVK